MPERHDLDEELIRCLPRMLASARRILKDPGEAQDAVQDACIHAYKGFGTFDGRGDIGAWLQRIVINAALARLRKKSQLAETQIDELMPEYDRYGVLLGDPDWKKIDAETLLQKKGTKEAVKSAIDDLPERARLLLILRDLEGFDTAEVAAALDISTGAVKTGLHRARLALKKLLKPIFDEDGL